MDDLGPAEINVNDPVGDENNGDGIPTAPQRQMAAKGPKLKVQPSSDRSKGKLEGYKHSIKILLRYRTLI